MRLKKVMAIVLAGGLTVGSIALAATSNPLSSLKGVDPSSSPVATADVPPIINPSGSSAPTESTAPTESAAPSESTAPSTDPSTEPSTEPSTTPSATPTSTPKPTPAVKKPAKPSASKKTVKGAKKKITVKISKQSSAAGYQIQYATKKNMSGAKTKNVAKFSAKTKTVTISGLKKGTYYVRIRAYKKSGSKKVWGNYSSKITVKVTK